MAVAPKERILAPRGTNLTCKGWQQEAVYRMLQNNLEVAEDPAHLIVYGGTGKAARNWDCYYTIIETLKALEGDETLLIQSGKPVAVFKTHPGAPRVLISNAMLVPAWSTWEVFWDLEAKGLTMFGQMTAGSWINIGGQGIIQGTFETFAALGDRYFAGTLAGRVVLTGGLGMFSGAMPLAVTMNGGVCIAVEVDPARIKKRQQTGYGSEMFVTDDPDEALRLAYQARDEKIPRSIALLGNAADVFPDYLRRGAEIDVVTDQTSAHDPLGGYFPRGYSVPEALALRVSDPEEYVRHSLDSIVEHVRAMVGFKEQGAVVFEYGNNIRQHAKNHGYPEAFAFPGFVVEYLRPLFCEGRGPFRWVALSGDPEDIYRTEEAALAAFPEDTLLRRWINLAHTYVPFEGLPARLCYMGLGERAEFGHILNDLVRTGQVKAPMVIGRDHLDTGSVASPNRETEGMLDGSDAIADWPILNALINAVSGATWVSVHHGGGVGIGYAIHAGMVIVADGTDEADQRIERVLTADPGIGVVRHADAGYDIAIRTAKEKGLNTPMLK